MARRRSYYGGSTSYSRSNSRSRSYTRNYGRGRSVTRRVTYGRRVTTTYRRRRNGYY